MDKNTDVGAINNPAQLARIEELIEAGVAEGAELRIERRAAGAYLVTLRAVADTG